MRAEPEISARLPPSVENGICTNLRYSTSICIDDGNETNDVIDYFALLKPRKIFLVKKLLNSLARQLTFDIIDLKCYLTLRKIGLTKIKTRSPPLDLSPVLFTFSSCEQPVAARLLCRSLQCAGLCIRFAYASEFQDARELMSKTSVRQFYL